MARSKRAVTLSTTYGSGTMGVDHYGSTQWHATKRAYDASSNKGAVAMCGAHVEPLGGTHQSVHATPPTTNGSEGNGLGSSRGCNDHC